MGRSCVFQESQTGLWENRIRCHVFAYFMRFFDRQGGVNAADGMELMLLLDQNCTLTMGCGQCHQQRKCNGGVG